MKAKLRTTFEMHGACVTGHIEDAEMYEDVKNGKKDWKDTVYQRITHIRIPKEVFERLLELERRENDE